MTLSLLFSFSGLHHEVSNLPTSLKMSIFNFFFLEKHPSYFTIRLYSYDSVEEFFFYNPTSIKSKIFSIISFQNHVA